MLAMHDAPAMSADTVHTTVACKLGDLTVVARERDDRGPVLSSSLVPA